MINMTDRKLTKEQCFPPSYDGLKTLILPFKTMTCGAYKERNTVNMRIITQRILCDYCHMKLFRIG